MIIRAAGRDDLPAINEILNEAIRNTTANWAYQERSMEAARAWFEAHGAPNRPLLVAEEDGRIVGYGCLSAFRDKEGYWPVAENSVYVHRDWRGRGVGTTLMKRLIDLGREAGLRVITAWVDADNQGSIAFHESLGFQRAGGMAGIGEKFGRRLGVTILNLELEERKDP